MRAFIRKSFNLLLNQLFANVRDKLIAILILSFYQPKLDFVLVAVILLSHKYKVNPDNMATPLAASIGDVVSISLLSFITSVLFRNLGEFD